MLERYEIEKIDQLRAVADMLRLRIIDMLQERPMTVTQLGDVLGEAPAKVHYHVRELEKVGLLRLVETREKSGILEKYYQPIAREFSVEKTLLSAPSDEALAMTNAWLNQIKDGFQRAFRKALEQKEEKPRMSIGFTRMYVTAEEQEQLCKQIMELVKPYENRRGREEEQEILGSLLIYPQVAFEASAMPDGRSISQDQFPHVAESSTYSTWVVGAVDFKRSDMEKALQEGKRLHINVTGLCHFADDVSADLADRAIERIHVIGKLLAPSAVREVLMRKRNEM